MGAAKLAGPRPFQYHGTMKSAEVVPILAALAQETRLVLEGMLQRGFTTVRDCGGADYGLADAVERGLINGPRIFYSGRVLTQTGGHADFRSRSAGIRHGQNVVRRNRNPLQ